MQSVDLHGRTQPEPGCRADRAPDAESEQRDTGDLADELRSGRPSASVRPGGDTDTADADEGKCCTDKDAQRIARSRREVWT